MLFRSVKSKTNRGEEKTFKFLIHQAFKNKDLSTSFNRYYKSGESFRGKSQTVRENKKANNDSFNKFNIEKNNNIRKNDFNKPLGLKYFNTESKYYDENNANYKKYKNFYSSFRNIGRVKEKNNTSYDETLSKDDKKNTFNESKINNKLNNLKIGRAHV